MNKDEREPVKDDGANAPEEKEEYPVEEWVPERPLDYSEWFDKPYRSAVPNIIHGVEYENVNEEDETEDEPKPQPKPGAAAPGPKPGGADSGAGPERKQPGE